MVISQTDIHDNMSNALNTMALWRHALIAKINDGKETKKTNFKWAMLQDMQVRSWTINYYWFIFQ